MWAPCQPVRYTSDSVSSDGTRSLSSVMPGTAMRLPSASGIRASSACSPPFSGVPYQPPCTHAVWKPSRQNTQVLSWKAKVAITKSPFFTRVTAAPVSSTTPTSSCPIGVPSAVCGSE